MHKYFIKLLLRLFSSVLIGCLTAPACLSAQSPGPQLVSAPTPSLCIACGFAQRFYPSASMDAMPQGTPKPVGTKHGAHKPEQTAKKGAQPEVYSPTATTGSPKHIFWVVPAFKVNYAGKFEPLTPREKFHEWAQSTYDPLGLGVGAVEAGTLEYSPSDGFCGYGFGWAGYGKCFGSLQLDATDSSFFGDFVFTVLMHQDPRYFRLGKGSFARRGLYAVSRVFVTFNDSGRNVFYSSGLSGTVMAAFVSNLYYPKSDRGIGLTVSRIGIDLGNTALYNGAAEFWPDFDRWFDRHF